MPVASVTLKELVLALSQVQNGQRRRRVVFSN